MPSASKSAGGPWSGRAARCRRPRPASRRRPGRPRRACCRPCGSWPGYVDEVDARPWWLQGQVGVADVDGHAAPTLLGWTLGVDPGQRPEQGRLAVVDVPGRADDDGFGPRPRLGPVRPGRSNARRGAAGPVGTSRTSQNSVGDTRDDDRASPAATQRGQEPTVRRDRPPMATSAQDDRSVRAAGRRRSSSGPSDLPVRRRRRRPIRQRSRPALS